MAKQRTQQDYRRDLNPRDQFGRKWLMQIELATGDPTGGIYPAGWVDPLRTPMQFIRVPRNEDGQSEIGKVKIHFNEWIQQQEEAERVWYQQLHANARDVYKRLDPGTVRDLEHDKFLLDLTGTKPWPSPTILKAAMAGDKGYLGLAPLASEQRIALGQATVEDLQTHVAPDDSTPPSTYQEFVSWAFRTGAAPKGDLKAAAELWRDHAKQLQAA